MPPTPSQHDFTSDELRRLVSAWCDEVISEADLARLQAELLADEHARLEFIAYMNVHGAIKTEIIGREHLEAFVALPQNQQHHSAQSESTTSTPAAEQEHAKPRLIKLQRWLGIDRPARWSWAAALLLVLAGGALAWQLFLIQAVPPAVDHPAIAQTQPTAPPTAGSLTPAAILARVSEQSPDCQWYFDRSGKLATDEVRRGDTVRVTSGIMKLRFQNETLVTLHAPALFEIVSEMRARVLLGKVTAKIGPTAKGFSVITPQATVVDLGTEFGIQVNDVGATDVVVFKGAVDVDYPATLEGAARQQRLRTGEAVHLDAAGTASRIVSITNGQFADQPRRELRPPIITEVRDNIQREAGSWNYYEIVHAGMAEDAKAFVDREAHEWNGITPAGMPSYLLGGDYVKTFNNDKVRHEIEITLSVAQPCRLYILFDDRIPPPRWLEENFRPTGDKIGVDEGPWMSNNKLRTEHQAGVGPGVSIDNIDSVWVRDIPAPGAIELGGTETPINSINMYGIVAVPLDTAATATEQKQPTKGNTNEVNVNDKSAGKGRIDSGTRK
jgi:hypothetical protein